MHKDLKKDIVRMVDSHPNSIKLTPITRSTMFLSICSFVSSYAKVEDDLVKRAKALHEFISTRMDSL